MATKQPDFESTATAAARVGFTRAWVKRLAATGQIPGAFRLGARAWVIPSTWNPQRQRARKRLPGSPQ